MSLEFLNFGEMLNSLRVYKGLDVQTLAEGICSEEDLLDFEKEAKYPTLDQLHKLSQKLNVELSYFFDKSSVNTYVTTVMELIKKYKRDRNYQAISEIVNREKENPLFNHPPSKQFLLWHEAICNYYLAEEENKEAGNCVSLLYDALKITNPSLKGLNEREIEILMAIALIEKDEKNFEKSILLLKEVLENLDQLPFIVDPRIRLRALFGLSQALSESDKYEESLYYSNKGVSHCINDEVMYLMGELYYQSGENYIKIGEREKGIENINKSIRVFELQKNEKFVNLVKLEMEKLFNGC